MKPVVIIGAPRSGTNMLRDALCKIADVATWPCDEINPIWKHGNLSYKTDELPATAVTAAVKKHIRSNFHWVSQHYQATTVVEKTCANCLRVPFVDAVVPEAKFIYIYRDGIDVAASALQRWTADVDLPYILAKARFVPKIDLPYYALSFIRARLYRTFSDSDRISGWGPSFSGMDKLLDGYELHEACAMQWEKCVLSAEQGFERIHEDRVKRICYEDFVRQPAENLESILEFLQLSTDRQAVNHAVADVTSRSIGKGRASFSSEKIERIENLIKEGLQHYGYMSKN